MANKRSEFRLEFSFFFWQFFVVCLCDEKNEMKMQLLDWQGEREAHKPSQKARFFNLFTENNLLSSNNKIKHPNIQNRESNIKGTFPVTHG